jgi:hypothetical protein
MSPLTDWPQRYGEAFSEVDEVVRVVEIATRTRYGMAGETYRLEVLQSAVGGMCKVRYQVRADGRWVEVNLGHAGPAENPDAALSEALSAVASAAHSAR